MAVQKQVAIIFAATNGYLDSVASSGFGSTKTACTAFLETQHAGVLSAIAEKKILDDDLKQSLKAALEDYGRTFAASTAAA